MLGSLAGFVRGFERWKLNPWQERPLGALRQAIESPGNLTVASRRQNDRASCLPVKWNTSRSPREFAWWFLLLEILSQRDVLTYSCTRWNAPRVRPVTLASQLTASAKECAWRVAGERVIPGRPSQFDPESGHKILGAAKKAGRSLTS